MPSSRLLSEHLRQWLDGKVKSQVRERTWRDYERDLSRAGLLPPEPNRKRAPSMLARIPLRELTIDHLEQFYTSLATSGMPQEGCKPLGERSIRYVHTLLHAALKAAVRQKLLAVNPADGAQLPRVSSGAKNTLQVEREEQRIQALTAEQVNRLLEVSSQRPPVREGPRKGVRGNWKYQPSGDKNRFHALWHVLVKGGLRPNEGLGLTWNDVEWDRNALRVNRTLVRGVGGGWKAEEPKTAQSRRVVTLPPDTMQALLDHKRQQEDELAVERETMTQAEQGQYRDHGFVFAGRHGEPLDLKNITARHFVPLLEAAKLPRIRVYDLRHTHATLLLAANVPVHVVSKRLGHKSPKMTLEVYAHVLTGQQEEAVERMEEYLSAVK